MLLSVQVSELHVLHFCIVIHLISAPMRVRAATSVITTSQAMRMVIESDY